MLARISSGSSANRFGRDFACRRARGDGCMLHEATTRAVVARRVTGEVATKETRRALLWRRNERSCHGFVHFYARLRGHGPRVQQLGP